VTLIGRAVATWVGTAFLAQAGAAIYSCVDASGRRISSDRPIAECMDREQRILNPSGTTRQSVGPALSESERAAQDERRRREEVERLRASEDRLRQRALLSRYPNAEALARDRAGAIAPLEEVIASAGARLAALDAERARLEAQRRQAGGADVTRALEQVELQRASQERFLNNKRAEKELMVRRFADMARQLEVLWAQQGAAASR
jgi:hypothetical protein